MNEFKPTQTAKVAAKIAMNVQEPPKVATASAAH
jgi:hypothetical protein